MKHFDNTDAFRSALAGTRKWERALEAVAAAPRLAPGVTYSIGDSLTYLVGDSSALGTTALIGRRRYHFVIAALYGEVAVEVASQQELQPLAGYDDLTDRQPFRGAATAIHLPEGALLIADIDDAARILPTPDSTVVQLHVTVEGGGFHNK
jgi:evolved beta-galactosidase subunit beta